MEMQEGRFRWRPSRGTAAGRGEAIAAGAETEVRAMAENAAAPLSSDRREVESSMRSIQPRRGGQKFTWT